MSTTTEESNKALVLEAFDTLFNKRDYEAAARFWSPSYIQHSAHIEPGREGLFRHRQPARLARPFSRPGAVPSGSRRPLPARPFRT